MPRPNRLVVAGHAHHLIQRGPGRDTMRDRIAAAPGRKVTQPVRGRPREGAEEENWTPVEPGRPP
jgi:hypothetical protein